MGGNINKNIIWAALNIIAVPIIFKIRQQLRLSNKYINNMRCSVDL